MLLSIAGRIFVKHFKKFAGAGIDSYLLGQNNNPTCVVSKNSVPTYVINTYVTYKSNVDIYRRLDTSIC